MKILIVTTEIGQNAGGLSLTCFRLKQLLMDLGHEVCVENSSSNNYDALDGGYDPDLGKKIRYSRTLEDIYDKYKEKELSLIIAYGASENALFAKLLSAKLHINFYIVLCGSDINLSLRNGPYLFVNKICLDAASKIIALSEQLKDNANAITKCEYKCLVIPNYYTFNEQPQLKKNKTLKENFLFASGSAFLNEKKGTCNLIKAFSIYIEDSKREDTLYLFGKIDEDIKNQYEKLIKENRMEKRIIIGGYHSREDYLELLKDVDIYVQLSPFEGCSNSVAEAIIRLKNILISDTGYFAEKLKGRFDSCLLKSLNPADVAKSMYDYVINLSGNDNRLDIYNYFKEDINYNSIMNKWKRALEGNCYTNNQTINSGNCLAVLFHDINNQFTGIDYPVSAFKELLYLIHKNGKRLCSAKEYLESENKENLIICTFDDGYCSVINNAFPEMVKYGFTGTVFVCPDLLGMDNSWNHRDEVIREHMRLEDLKTLFANKWEIGSHGMSHYNLKRLSQTELESSLKKSKEFLEKEFGHITTFCYPYGIYNEYIMSKVEELYDIAFSVSCGGTDLIRDKYQLTRLVPEELKKLLEK